MGVSILLFHQTLRRINSMVQHHWEYMLLLHQTLRRLNSMVRHHWEYMLLLHQTLRRINSMVRHHWESILLPHPTLRRIYFHAILYFSAHFSGLPTLYTPHSSFQQSTASITVCHYFSLTYIPRAPHSLKLLPFKDTKP